MPLLTHGRVTRRSEASVFWKQISPKRFRGEDPEETTACLLQRSAPPAFLYLRPQSGTQPEKPLYHGHSVSQVAVSRRLTTYLQQRAQTLSPLSFCTRSAALHPPSVEKRHRCIAKCKSAFVPIAYRALFALARLAREHCQGERRRSAHSRAAVGPAERIIT